MIRLLRLLFVLALLAASPAWAVSNFIDHGDGTVSDSATGLMWDKCSWGQSDAACATGAASLHHWQEALALAVSANGSNYKGHNDWRLPNKNELESLVDLTRFIPSIDPTFPNTESNGYWSSTNYAVDPATTAWAVMFDYGYPYHANNKTFGFYVRLVRSGQTLNDSFDAQGAIPPVLTAVGVSGTTTIATTLAATSDEVATGYWIVVAQGSAAPTAAQVKAGANYGAVTVVASGNGAMTAAVAKNFSVTGLTAATAYDLYVVAEDSSSNHNLTPATTKVQFTTLAVVNGACGSDNGATLTATPTNLCTAGTPSAVTPGNTSYDWTCTGANGGSDASCSATRNYVVTSSVSGGNGTVSASQTVAYNATPSFTLTPNAGYTSGPVSGACGGSLSGNTYTTNAVTTSCTVVASFTAVPAVITNYTASSATGSGNISASFSGGGAGCSYSVSQYIPLTGHAASPPAGSAPAGTSFPHGLFDFTTSGCTAGATITMTITYPSALAAGTVYWKYGPTPTDASYHWYQLPATIVGNTATFSITDGGLGDDDLTANGTIVDQGGPGGGGAVGVPALSEWSMLALIGLMGLFGMRRMARTAAGGLNPRMR